MKRLIVVALVAAALGASPPAFAAGRLAPSTKHLNFRAVTVGTSRALTVIVTNRTGYSFTSASGTMTGINRSDFWVEFDGCLAGSSITPGDFCSFGVYFDPSSAGRKTASFVATFSGPGVPRTSVSVGASGRGVAG